MLLRSTEAIEGVTATIVLKAETNSSRRSTVTLSLGASDKNGSRPKPKKKKK